MDETPESEVEYEGIHAVAYRCSCGGDVILPDGGEGDCHKCGRRITLAGLSSTQTVSFCSDLGSGTAYHLTDGPDRSGELLGHFRLISKLGYGGMGAVYRAQDESLQRFVAVKVLRSMADGGSSSTKQVARLLHEAVAQARLNHPNVVTIYYVGRAGEEPFLAMELLPGPTLAQRITNGPLPYADVIHFSRQVCAALRQANSLGLVHGDIKPSNLILSDEGVVKLGDFGLARTEASRPTSGISGTLTYMAPELAEGGEPSAQSDMYSLGVTLFELTFGRRPYALFGTTLKEQLKSQLDASIAFPERWPSEVPSRWRAVLERLMSREPSDRYANYEELESVLVAHAPVGFTNAGLLSRSLALAVDYIALGLLMVPFMIPAQLASQAALTGELPDYIRNFVDRFSMLSLMTPVVPLIATWAEWRGWRTLGRYALQIRVVDEHGIRLDRNKRVVRSLFRNATIWGTSLSISALTLGFDMAVILLSPIDEIILLMNTIPVLGPRRLALHDRLVGSRVVLDTKSDP